MAGTALRGAITRLLNPSNEAQDILTKLGITVLDAEGNMRPLVDIIRDLEFGGLTAGDAMTLFGQRAGPAMLALIEQGSGALADLTEEMRNSDGVTKDIADTMLDTFGGNVTLLTSMLEDLALSIGTILVPFLQQLVENITPVIEKLSAWMKPRTQS